MNQINSEKEESTLSIVLKELRESFSDVVRSEMKLAQVEFKEVVSDVRNKLTSAAIFSGVAALGILPFLAFCVIGLGALLNGNYWLSALIVSLICFGVGGLVAYRSFRAIKFSNLSLPRTRYFLKYEARALKTGTEGITSPLGEKVKSSVTDIREAAGIKRGRNL